MFTSKKTKTPTTQKPSDIETITLNNEERDILLSTLDNPPVPNEELKNLLKSN